MCITTTTKNATNKKWRKDWFNKKGFSFFYIFYDAGNQNKPDSNTWNSPERENYADKKNCVKPKKRKINQFCFGLLQHL